MQSIHATETNRKDPRNTRRRRTPDLPALTRSPEDAATFAGVGRSAVYDALAVGDLKARKLGRRTLILEEDLRAWIASLPSYATA